MYVLFYRALVDCDHIGWKARKLITRSISPTRSFFVAQRPSTYSQRSEEHGKILRRLEVWWGKVVVCWTTKAAISLKREKDRVNVTVLVEGLYRNSPTLFRTVPSQASLTLYDLLFPKIGGSQTPPKTPIATRPISGTGEAMELKILPKHSQCPSEQKLI